MMTACSFMIDTAQALSGLLRRPVGGVVHLDNNADEGHSFLDIVLAALSRRLVLLSKPLAS